MLEFILGDALHAKVNEVLTFGAAGSNHALATAIYAQQLGLKSISMLRPQPNAHCVRRNLLMSYNCGAELHLYSNIPFVMPLAAPAVLYQLLRHRLKCGQFPQVIPIGGSSPLGVVGFVNAAFELKQQILVHTTLEIVRRYVSLASAQVGVQHRKFSQWTGWILKS